MKEDNEAPKIKVVYVAVDKGFATGKPDPKKPACIGGDFI